MKYVYKVRINYKSGISEEMWFDTFSVNQTNGELNRINFETNDNNKQPLHFGINDIESVFIVGKRNTFLHWFLG